MKAKKTGFQLADGRKLICYDEHPGANRQIQDTRDLGRPTVRSEIRAVVRDADGDLWLAYHGWDSSAVGDGAGGQRSMWLDGLRFEGGRPKVEGPTDGPQEAP